MSKTRKLRLRWILAFTISAALAGCSSHPITKSLGAGGTGSGTDVPLLLTDTPPAGVTPLSFEVTISSAMLEPGDVQLLTAPVTQEITRLQTETAYLSTTSVSNASYTSLKLTFSNPSLTFVNNTAATITVNPHTAAPLTHTISSPINLIGGLDVTVADPADQLTLSGGLNGVGPVTLTSTNLGTVLLSGPGTYSGGTAVYGGTLVVGSADALPDGSDLTVGAGAAFAAGAAASPVAVPEPGAIALLVAAAMAALAATRRRRQIAN